MKREEEEEECNNNILKSMNLFAKIENPQTKIYDTKEAEKKKKFHYHE